MSEKEILEKCKILLQQIGYTQVDIKYHPTDLVAEKDGETVNIEVKSTAKSDYFGAATLTEWAVDLRDGALKYLVVKFNAQNEIENYNLYDAPDFYKYSTIPPFKVNFNIDLKDRQKHTKHPRAVTLDGDVLHILHIVHSILKSKDTAKIAKLKSLIDEM